MDIKGKEFAPFGKSSQSTEAKGICVLVMNDDLAYHNIVSEMLEFCSYEVLHVGGFQDVLNAVWEIKDGLDYVVTNVHNLESHGTTIARCIEENLNINVLLLDHGSKKVKPNVKPISFAAYVLDGLSIDDVDRLWRNALEKGKAANPAYQEQNAQKASVPNTEVAREKTSLPNSEAACSDQTKKRPKEKYERNEVIKESPAYIAKKPRVVWTIEMQQKFLEAIEIIGYDRAVPKKIVQVMGIPGLTRENVASHLQKFRGSLKRTQKTALNSLSSSSMAKGFKGLLVSPSPTASRLNSLPTNTKPLLRSSCTYTAKDSINTLQSHYLNMHSKFYLEMKNNAATGGLLSRDPSEVGKFLQKYVPRLQLSPNFRIYGDQTRNMLISIGNNSLSVDSNQFGSGRFVGYRLTSDGSSIEFGKPKEATVNDKVSRETQVFTPGACENQSASHSQHNLFSDENPSVPTVCISQQPSLVGSSSGEPSFQFQPVLGIERVGNPTQSITTTASNSPQEQLALFSSIFPSDQDFLMPALETLPAQNSMAFLDGISLQPYSPSSYPQVLQHFDDLFGLDDTLQSGTESTSAQFDVAEFDDTLFKHVD